MGLGALSLWLPSVSRLLGGSQGDLVSRDIQASAARLDTFPKQSPSQVSPSSQLQCELNNMLPFYM